MNGFWNRLLRQAFFWLVVRPIVFVVIGLNVRRRELLPTEGPGVVIANHNSHLDTMVLMTVLPSGLLPKIRPVAAADYFLRNRWIAWFATQIIGILPIRRDGRREGEDPFADAHEALGRGEILVLFPEGTRGEPERLAAFKSGVAHLAKAHPEVPVTPVFLYGLGKALPKGSILPVPFFCDVFVGKALHGRQDHKAFLADLSERFGELVAEGKRAELD